MADRLAYTAILVVFVIGTYIHPSLGALYGPCRSDADCTDVNAFCRDVDSVMFCVCNGTTQYDNGGICLENIPTGDVCNSSTRCLDLQAMCKDVGTNGIQDFRCSCTSGYTNTDGVCVSDQECGQNPSSAVTSGFAFLTQEGNTTYESIAIVICFTGYESPTTTITCQPDGKWSTATCSKKDCGPHPTLMNGAIANRQTTYQAEAIYTCNAGYIVDGTASNTTTITCQSNGDWSIEFPTCSVDAKPLGAGCLNPANTNAAASDLCNGVNALCDRKTILGNEFTCQCNTGFYDDNGNGAAGSCKPISDLQVQLTNLTSKSTTSFTVSWYLPADKHNFVNSYMVEWIEKGSSLQDSFSPLRMTRSYSISIYGLISGRAYTVRVISRNSVDYTSTIKTTYVTKEQAIIPQTPGAVIAGSSDLDAEDKYINVTWTGSTGDVSEYEWKLLDNNEMLSDGTTASSNASINYSGIKNGYRYTISITALSKMFDGGKTIRSETHTEKIKTVVKAPTEPRQVQCQTTTDTSVTIKWEEPLLPNGDLREYKIDTYVLDTNSKLNTKMTGDLELTYEITGLQPGSYYYFYVYTVNELFTSQSTRLSTSFCATRANVSDIPNNLNVSDVQRRSFMVSWTKPTNTYGENMGYIVQVRTVDDACVTELIITCMGCTQSFNLSSLENMCPSGVSITEQRTKASIDSDVYQTYTITSLNPYVNYSVTVTAVNSAGRGRIASVIVQTDEEAITGPSDDNDDSTYVVIVAVIVSIVVVASIVSAVVVVTLRKKKTTDNRQTAKIPQPQESHDDESIGKYQNAFELSDVTQTMTNIEVMAWLNANDFKDLKQHFKKYTGKDLLALSKDDVARICGAADGIRLFNRMREWTVNDAAPLRVSEGDINTHYADLDETTQDRVPYENIELNEAHMYSSLNY